MEKLNIFQRFTAFIASKAGFKVDLNKREIAKPEVQKKDAELIGHLEAKNAELAMKNKEISSKQQPKKQTEEFSITSFFKPENALPLGKIKYLQGVDGFIGDRVVNWYRIFRGGKEQIYFIIKAGKKLTYLGGRTLKETLKEPNLDVNKQTLLVNFNREGKYIPPKYLSVDVTPDITAESSTTQAMALIKSMADLLGQNSQLKEQIVHGLPARLNEIKKEYGSMMDSALSDINKQREEIKKFMEEKEKLKYELETLKKQYKENRAGHTPSPSPNNPNDSDKSVMDDIYNVGGVIDDKGGDGNGTTK